MVELFRERESRLADEIEAELQELCAAHTVTVIGEKESPSVGAELPMIRHGAQIVTGEEHLRAYLDALRKEVYDFSRRFTGDYCYLDDGGEVC